MQLSETNKEYAIEREALSAICAENKKLDMDDMLLDNKNECKS